MSTFAVAVKTGRSLHTAAARDADKKPRPGLRLETECQLLQTADISMNTVTAGARRCGLGFQLWLQTRGGHDRQRGALAARPASPRGSLPSGSGLSAGLMRPE